MVVPRPDAEPTVRSVTREEIDRHMRDTSGEEKKEGTEEGKKEGPSSALAGGDVTEPAATPQVDVTTLAMTTTTVVTKMLPEPPTPHFRRSSPLSPLQRLCGEWTYRIHKTFPS